LINTRQVKEASVADTFNPLGDRVVIRPLEGEEITQSGLVLPDTAIEKPQKGEVIAVGPGRIGDDGKRIAMEVKVKDKIVYSKYAGTELKEDDVDYLILRESDILATIA
jgi:chaperonin GroES